jgi:hypothetical protein
LESQTINTYQNELIKINILLVAVAEEKFNPYETIPVFISSRYNDNNTVFMFSVKEATESRESRGFAGAVG